jgi:hypothetical protein
VTKDDRGLIADWLVLLSGVVLFASLFLTWSRLSPAYLAVADQLQTLQGVAREPTAWQAYSAADVVLAVLAVAMLVVALIGSKSARIITIAAALVALAFVVHAANVPPTNGAADAFRPSLDVPVYVAPAPKPGPGETVAIIALVVAMGGIALSLASD